MRRAWLAVPALAACTQIYYKDFAVEAGEANYPPMAQYEDIKRYGLERGLPVTGEGPGFIKFDLGSGDTLEVRVAQGPRVELTLVRVTSGEDFSARDLEQFRDRLEARLREQTGRIVRVRLAGERERARSNVTFPGGFP